VGLYGLSTATLLLEVELVETRMRILPPTAKLGWD